MSESLNESASPEKGPEEILESNCANAKDQKVFCSVEWNGTQLSNMGTGTILGHIASSIELSSDYDN